jgi:hypothetical protein
VSVRVRRPAADQRAVHVHVVEDRGPEVVGTRVLPLVEDDREALELLARDVLERAGVRVEGGQLSGAAPAQSGPAPSFRLSPGSPVWHAGSVLLPAPVLAAAGPFG